MQWLYIFWLASYSAVIAFLAFYALYRLLLIGLRIRFHRQTRQLPAEFDSAPLVTVQLPVFNERFVVKRLLSAVSKLDWPRDRLEIQVLNDSTDDTVRIVRDEAAKLKTEGFDITVIERSEREGFKAGALDVGTKIAKGEFLFILDADFVPAPDALRQLLPHFARPEIGMVQARWGHLNRGKSILTRIQAMMLDVHFRVEQLVRNRTNCLIHFHGTAGIFRKKCIEDAGGWEADTLTEDKDLSFRAQLKGWKFVYLDDLVIDGELPEDLGSFKTQQHRWIKGGIETLFKLWKPVWRANIPLSRKIEASVQLLTNFVHLAGAALCVLSLAIPILDLRELAWLWIFSGVVIGLSLFSSLWFHLISLGKKRSFVDILHIPLALAIGLGMSIANSKAIFEALFGHRSDFIRTPKIGDAAAGNFYLEKRRSLPILEFVFAAYFAGIVGYAIFQSAWIAVPLPFLSSLGFFYVAIQSIARNQPAKA